MPATRFDGANDNIITGTGGLAASFPTASTLIAIVRTNTTLSDGSWQAVGPCVRQNSSTARFGLERDTANLLALGNDTTTAKATSFASTDGWSIVAASWTPAGAPLLVVGGNLVGTTNWKTTTGSTLSITAGTIQDIIFGEWGGNVDDLNGWLACAAIFDQALTLAQIQECVANRRTSDIWNNSAGRPKALWQFNATGVTDLTGNGADELSRSGATIDAAETPPWSFDGLGSSSKVPVRLGTYGNASGVANNSFQTTSAVPAGGRVIVPVQWASDTNTTVPVVSGGGLKFMRDYRTTATEGTVRYGIDYWSAYAQQGLPSGTTININFITAGVVPFGLNTAAYYAMGLARGQSLDGTANVFRTTPTSTWTAGPITTTNASDLIMTTAYSDHASVLNSSTPLAGGFTELDDFWIGGTDWAMVNSYREVAATGTYTATGTWLNSPSFADFTAMVVYKAGSEEALDASNSEYGDGTYGKGAYGMRWESDPAVTSTWTGTVARRYLHMSNSPFNQSWTPATSALRHSAITLHGATAQPSDHNAIKTASATTDVGFYVDLGYADNGAGLQTVFTAAECRLQGWLAYDNGAEFANPFGGDSVLVDLGAPGIAEGAVKRIKQKFADAITAGSSQAFDYVFLDDINIQFTTMVNAAQVPDGYTSSADYSARAVVPTLKYIAQAMWNDGVKFIVPNLGDWVNLDDQTSAYTAVRSGFNEQATNGVPRVNRSSGQLTRMYNVLRDAATNGNRVFLMTPLIDQNDTQTALYGWAYANIVGEPGTTYHAVAGPNGWYGYDSPTLTEYTVNLGAPLEGPQISGNLYSRRFTNYTVYANVGGTSVTIPADSSTLTALTGRFDATSTPKTASDSATNTDNAGSIAASALRTDTATTSDGAAANLSNLLSRVDSWTLTDVAALVTQLLLSANDSVTVTDLSSLLQTLALAANDTVTTVDSSAVSAAITSLGDSWSATELSAINAVIDRTDSWTVADLSSVLATLAINATDSLSMLDSSSIVAAVVSVGDSWSESELSSLLATITAIDSWAVTDVSAILATLALSASDSLTVGELASIVSTLAVLANDSAVQSEGVTALDAASILADSATQTDDPSSTTAAVIASETVTLTDIVSLLATGVDASDSASVLDAALLTSTLLLTTTDSSTLSELVYLDGGFVQIGVSDSSALSENVVSIAVDVSTVDALALGDSAAAFISAVLDAADALAQSDASSLNTIIQLVGNDSLTLTELSAVSNSLATTDTFTAADAVIALTADLTASESVQLLAELATYAVSLAALESHAQDELLTTVTGLFAAADALTHDEASALANALSGSPDASTQNENTANLTVQQDRSDTLTAAEISAISATLAALDSSTLTDLVFSSGQQLNVSASDSWAMTELSSVLTQNIINATDSLSQSDSSLLAVAAAAGDALTLGEIVAINAAMVASDGIDLAESLAAAAQLTRFDSWVFTEASGALVGLDLADALTSSETASLVADAIAADTGTMAEALYSLANVIASDSSITSEYAELLLAKSAMDAWVLNAVASLAEYAGEAPETALPTYAIIGFIATVAAIQARQASVEVVDAPKTTVEVVQTQTSVEVTPVSSHAEVTSRLNQTEVT